MFFTVLFQPFIQYGNFAFGPDKVQQVFSEQMKIKFSAN